MKSWVMISGSLDGNNYPTTFIKQPAVRANKGTVVAASNCTLQNVSVHADANSDAPFAVAMECYGVSPFTITNCDLYADDHGFDVESVVPLSIDFLHAERPAKPSSIWTDFTDLYATGAHEKVYPAAVIADAGAYAQLFHAELVALGRDFSCGGATYSGANIVFQLCKITGKTWSLVIPFGNASMTARNCQLTGPVDPRVKVINTGESDA
jgi:hypothetical protein